MTFGEKLIALRKQNHQTQEELAELLGVSRQTISKWESDQSYPETDRIIRIGKMYNASLDDLLCDERDLPFADTDGAARDSSVNADENGSAKFAFISSHIRTFSCTSKKTVRGLPLWQIGRNAHAIFACGLHARGIVACGLFARGIVSYGLLSLGLLSFGAFSIGLAAFGGIAVGGLAFGAIAAGIIAAGGIAFGVAAFGGISIGCFSVGGLAIGRYLAIGDNATGIIAIGKSVAHGSMYGFLGEIKDADIDQICRALGNTVPAWLSWTVNVAEKLLSMFT